MRKAMILLFFLISLLLVVVGGLSESARTQGHTGTFAGALLRGPGYCRNA